jgi:hypothetical protein
MERRVQGTPQEARPLIDLDAISKHLCTVAAHYELSAPAVSHWADTLYMTMQEDLGNVTLREVITASALLEEGQWEQPNFAANRIYKLMESKKQDTTGHAGF